MQIDRPVQKGRAVSGVLYVGVVRFLPPVQAYLVLRPLSWRRARRAGLDRSTWRHLRGAARAHITGHTARPGDVLGDLLRHRETPDRPTPWTSWRSSLETCLARATAPDSALIAARFVVPEQVERLDELLSGMAELLARFDRVAPVPRATALMSPRGGGEVASSTFATALSGAAVLVDAGSSRGGAADSVLVWADTTFRDDETGWRERRTYADATRGLVFDENSRLGDYNGRLIELNAVTLAANSSEGEVCFVLETTETSYQATEPPRRLAAKRLSPTSQDAALPVFRSEGSASYRRQAELQDGQRTCPVTSYVSLMTRSMPVEGIEVHGLPSQPTGPVDMVVLCRRSTATRHGTGTLSATAGGVVELDQRDVHLDTDALGAPDVTGSALREMTEELGIPREEVSVVPVAAFVATLDGRRGTAPGRGSGQLVASVLHIGTTPLGLAGLLRARHDASATRGAFEVDSLEAFAMSPGPSGLAAFAAAVREHADRLDQHGLLSCFYAALRYYASGVVEAFSDTFEVPWWSIPWTGEEQDGRLRVVRDVRRIMPDDRILIEFAARQWIPQWEDLPRRLGDEGAPGDGEADRLDPSHTD
jgi:8-oxo-dGTP pyrophosphatase MutT (NUDIX family)